MVSLQAIVLIALVSCAGGLVSTPHPRGGGMQFMEAARHPTLRRPLVIRLRGGTLADLGGGQKGAGGGKGDEAKMSDKQRRIKDIEAEMARTQKNKATMSHLCALKARLAALKREEAAAGSKSGPAGEGFDVKAQGDARVGFIGFPSVGKSTLLTKLTGVFSEAADYEFTTLTCVPGVMYYKGAKVQILDLPGIIEGAKDGKGRGRQVIGCARTCDLILLVLDAAKPVSHKLLIERELEGFGIRINKRPPNIYFKRKMKGGINLQALVPQSTLNKDLVSAILREYKMQHADIILKCDASEDDLIDVIEGNRVYIPCLYVFNKIDKISRQEVEMIGRKLPHFLPISGEFGWNIEALKAKIWQYMDLTRVYTKPKGQMPDFSEPVIMRGARTTVENFCNRIHKRLALNFKHALVWGASAKHTPMTAGMSHRLQDEDVIQVVKKAPSASSAITA